MEKKKPGHPKSPLMGRRLIADRDAGSGDGNAWAWTVVSGGGGRIFIGNRRRGIRIGDRRRRIPIGDRRRNVSDRRTVITRPVIVGGWRHNDDAADFLIVARRNRA